MHRKWKSSFIGMPHRSWICLLKGWTSADIAFNMAFKTSVKCPSPRSRKKSVFYRRRHRTQSSLGVTVLWCRVRIRMHTSCRTQRSNLEDRLMRSAGRCSPLVTFTISPTATYRSQFKIIKMEKKKITEKTNKQMDKGDRKFEIIIENNTC